MASHAIPSNDAQTGSEYSKEGIPSTARTSGIIKTVLPVSIPKAFTSTAKPFSATFPQTLAKE